MEPRLLAELIEKSRAAPRSGVELPRFGARLQRPQMPAMIVNLDDRLFSGPTRGTGSPYTSLGVLDPCITVERHGHELHIAARFNIETTILHYNSHKR